MSYPAFGADDSYSASDCILPETTVELIVDGDDYSEFYLGYDLSASRGQQCSGTIRLRDRDGSLTKRLSSFAQDNTSIRGHNMTDARTISLTVTQGSVVTDYPTLLPGVPSWDGQGVLTWAVSDFTPLLNKDNQSATDVLWDEGGPEDDKSAEDQLAVLATMAGVTINHTAPDWNIRTWRMTGENLLSKIDDLCKPTQSYRKWDGDTLILEQLNESATASESLVDRFHIASMTASKDDSGLRTYFKAFRLRSQAPPLTEPRTGDTVGFIEITFPDSSFVKIRHDCVHGTIGSGVFFNGDEEVNQFPGPQVDFYGPVGVTANRWQGVYTPEFGDIEYQPWWWLIAEGGSYNYNDTLVDGFDIEQVVTAAETLFGRRPEYSNLATELIREPETFEAMMTQLELEVLWSVRRFSVTSPFLRSTREGGFITTTHYGHGLTDAKLLLNGWWHSHSWESGWNNNYDLRAKL